MKKIRVALIGQPNVGKSFLINSVGSVKLRVGNFSGVTVEKTTVQFSRDGYDFEITDLPGCYSLTEYTIEERVTKQYMDEGDYDLILNVVDSTNIERNLYLTLELLALNKKIVVALNMQDEAIKEGVHIDEKQLDKLLGAPCVKTSALEKTGIDDLIKTIIQTHEQPQHEFHLQFGDVYEEEIAHIVSFLKEKRYKLENSSEPTSEQNLKAIAIKLLKEDKQTYQQFHDQPVWTELQPLLNQSYQHLYLHYKTKDLDEIFTDEKNSLAKGAVKESVTFDTIYETSLTDRIDAVLTNKIYRLAYFPVSNVGLIPDHF